MLRLYIGMRKIILYIIPFVALLSCQNESVLTKKAEQSYAIGEYYAAADFYKKAYAKVSPKNKEKRGKRAFMMGECYRRIGMTQKAVAAYQNAVRYNCEDSTALLHLGRQQLKAGMYKQAQQSFHDYLEKDPGNELAMNGLRSCVLVPEWKAKPNLYKIKKELVFNSRRSDYAPMLAGDDYSQLVFSTTKSGVEGRRDKRCDWRTFRRPVYV